MKNTILVVEDETDVRENIEEVLRNHSYEVITAGNGIEAIRILIKTTPDLIISDITLPGLNGLDLLVFTQNVKRLSNIPFILLTTRAFSEHEVHRMMMEEDSFIVKPYRAVDLLNIVELRLRGSK